eukprot:TRINITY_DN1550_c8_g1_i1.p1 TRINITY_DN1550_c8_g1~~TRINITY_DN1550_c8_g1_i1.p1  ORF type:complete len:209 (+),score=33.75 TRINITY_DN1550_c8_g1_i1:49-675(+)
MAVVGRVIGMPSQATPSPLLLEFQRQQPRQQPRQPAPLVRPGLVPCGYDVYGRVHTKMNYKHEREDEVEVVSRGWSINKSMMQKQQQQQAETTPPTHTLHNPYYMPSPTYTPTSSSASLSSCSSANNVFKLNEHAAPFTPQTPCLFIPQEQEQEPENGDVRGRPLESSLMASARSRSAASSASSNECSTNRPRSHSVPPTQAPTPVEG